MPQVRYFFKGAAKPLCHGANITTGIAERLIGYENAYTPLERLKEKVKQTL